MISTPLATAKDLLCPSDKDGGVFDGWRLIFYVTSPVFEEYGFWCTICGEDRYFPSDTYTYVPRKSFGGVE